MSNDNLILKLLIQAKDEVSGTIDKIGGGLDRFKGKATQLGVALLSAMHLDDVLGSLGNLVKESVAAGDKLSELKSRLELVTGSSDLTNASWSRLGAVAQKTRSDFGETVGLYTKMAQALKETGASQDEVIRLTTLVNQSYKISGASAEEAAQGTRQLGQALASGVLRGDEFNSMMESSPRLAQALAAGLGVPVSALRTMAEAGELTTAKITAALQSQAGAIDREFGRLPLTVSGATQQLSNAWMKFTGEFGQMAQGPLASSIQWISTHLADLGQLFLATFGTVAVRAVAPLAGAVGSAVTALGGLRGTAVAAAEGVGVLGSALKTVLLVAAVEGAIQIAKLGKATWDWIEASTAAAKQAEDTADAKDRLRLKIQDTLRATESYARTVLATGEDIAAMNRAEAESYLEKAQQAGRYYSALALQMKQAGNAEGFREAQAKADAFEQSVAAAEGRIKALKAAGVDSLPAIGAEAQKLVARFDELKNKGKETGDALKEMLKGGLIQDEDVAKIAQAEDRLDELKDTGTEGGKQLKAVYADFLNGLKTDSTQKVRAFGETLENLRATGKISAGDMRDAWEAAVKSLDPEQLQLFQRIAKTVFGDSKQHAEQFGIVMDVAVREQFKRLGVDADQALTGVSSGIRDAITTLDNLGRASALNGKTARDALSNLVDAAKTTQELEAIRGAIARMAQAGVLQGQDLVNAYALVEQAQKRIGVSAEEVRAAQARARASADQFAQALKAAGGDLTHLNQVLAQHPELQALAARASRDAAEAFRLQGLQAQDTGLSISQMAATITDREKAQAAAFNRQQDAAKQATQATHDAAEAAQQYVSVWAQTYQALGQYSEYAQQQMYRLGETLTNTSDWWTDINYGQQQLAELAAQGKRAEEAVARLGAQDMAELRDAIYDARSALNGLDGEKWDAMRKQVEDAEKRISETLAKQMQDRQKALEDFAEAREKADKKAEEAEVKSREDYVQAWDEALKKLSESQEKIFEDTAQKSADLARDYADELANIQNERFLFEQSIEDKIRDLRRDGMEEDQQRSDRQLELREKLAALQKSLAEGDVAEAERLRDKAVALAESLAKATQNVGQDQAQKEAIDALKQIKDINANIDEEKKTQAQKKHDDEMAFLEMEKRKSLADAKAVYDDAMVKAEAIRRKKVDDLNAAYQEELKLARQAHQEKMAQIDAENQARGASTATGDGKKTTITKRAKGGPVKKDEDYLVTEEGPETYVTDDGEAYRLESDGPTPFRAPKDGRILPAGATAPMRRLATASAGPADLASADTAARSALAATPAPAAPASAGPLRVEVVHHTFDLGGRRFEAEVTQGTDASFRGFLDQLATSRRSTG